MITLLILSLVIGAIVALIKRNTVEDGSLFAIFLLPFMITNVIIVVTMFVIPEVSHPSNVATPAKYTNQNYYIDINDNLYVDKNGEMQFVEKPKKQLIRYNELAKSATVEFKTTKTLNDNMSIWIPFYFESKTKTSISKITLPKAALTEKLTRVHVLNTSQSDASDLSLASD